jgi:hypothetical protein
MSCQCILGPKSKNPGKQCTNSSKDGTPFCGIHKNCSNRVGTSTMAPSVIVPAVHPPVPITNPVLVKPVERPRIVKPNLQAKERQAKERQAKERQAKERQAKERQAKERQERQRQTKDGRRCNNTDTLMGDSVDDIEDQYLYRSPNGNCFDIREIFQHIMSSGNYIDPYTGQLMWSNEADSRAILDHPGLEPAQRQALRSRLFDEEPLVDITVNVLQKNFDVLNQVAQLGMTMLGNYDVMEQFESCRYELNILMIMLESMPVEDRHTLLELKFTVYGMGELTLGAVIDMAQNTCVHTVGFYFLYFYIGYWRLLAENNVFMTLPLGIQPTTESRATLITVYNRSTNRAYVAIHIYDEAGRGLDSKMGYIGVYIYENRRFYSHITHVTREADDNMGFTDDGRIMSQLRYPTESETSIYDLIQQNIGRYLHMKNFMQMEN